MEELLQLPGEWTLDDSGERYPGVLFVDKAKRSVCLKIWFYGESQKSVEPFGIDFVRPIVTGRLMNGKCVTLAACVGIIMNIESSVKEPKYSSEYNITAKYAFINVDVNDENGLLFRGALVDYGDIGEWSQESVVDYEFGLKGSCKWEVKRKPQVQLRLRDGVLVFISAGVNAGRRNNMQAEVLIRQPTFVQFYYQTEESWDRIMDDVEIVRELIAFGMDRHIELGKIKTVHDSMLPPQMRGSQSFHASFSEEVYIGTKRKDLPFIVTTGDVCLSLPDVLQLLGQNDGQCQKRLSLLRPVIKLFLEAHIYTDELHVEKVFLNLARGLEAAHRSYDMISGGKGEYVAFWPRLKALLEPLCDIEGSGFSKANLKDDIKGIVDSRNYYTHYDPALYKVAMRDEQLAKLNRRLTKALRYYILKLLGLSESVAKERVGYGITPQCKVVGEEYAFGVGG